jgi:modulator of FtsH protease HflC
VSHARLAAAIVLGAAILLGIAIVTGALYQVGEAQQVVITQFGQPVGKPIIAPGLHFKNPFIQTAHYFEKRFLEWDGNPNQVPTRDKRFIWVDCYARWRITEPLLFFQRLRDETGAQSRLDDILDGETRNTVAKHDLIEVVRSTNRELVVAEEIAGNVSPETHTTITMGRGKLAQEVLQAAAHRTADLGIEILDFRFKRINYVEAVQKEVFERMISERKRIAEQYRSEGAGEAARINGEKERELQVITSEAYRQAQEIKGRAEAKATDIYAKVYSQDPDFYRFLKTMETYRQTLDADTVLVLSTKGELLRYLDQAK